MSEVPCTPGEDPLPGNQMTAEECKKYGLPPGSLWLDEVRFLAPKPQTLDPETQRSTLKLDPPERDSLLNVWRQTVHFWCPREGSK